MRRTTFGYTAQEFIDGIRSVQSFVKNEIVMLNMSRDVVVKTDMGCTDILKDWHLKMKAYCEAQLHMQNMKKIHDAGKGSVNRVYRKFLEGIVAVRDDDADSVEYTIASFAKLCNKAVDPEIIDILTFSTIPSMFKYFITARDHSDFHEFLVECDKEHVKHFRRAVFCTPHFAGFVESTVGPIIESLMFGEDMTINVASEFLTLVGEAWKEKLDEMPGLALSVLRGSGENWWKVLVDGFWLPFIACPHRWLGWEGYEYCGKLEHVKTHLEFSWAAFESIMTMRNVNVKQMENLKDGLVADHVWSSVDKDVLGFLATGRGKWKKSNEELSFVVQHTGNKTAVNDEWDLTATQNGTFKNKLHEVLREMLKQAPYIPDGVVNGTPMSKDVVTQLIEDYLVKPCTFTIKSKQIRLLDEWKENLESSPGLLPTDIKKLENMLNGMRLAHNQHARSLVELDRQKKCIASWFRCLSAALVSAPRTLRRLLIYMAPACARLSLSQTRFEIMSGKSMTGEVKKIYDSMGKWEDDNFSPQQDDAFPIYIDIVTLGIRFSAFRGMHPHLSVYDSIVQRSIHVEPDCVDDDMGWDDIKEDFDDSIAELQNIIAADIGPKRMLVRLTDWVDEVTRILQYTQGLTEMVPSEILHPVMYRMMSICEPHNTVSLAVYLKHLTTVSTHHALIWLESRMMRSGIPKDLLLEQS